MNEAQTRFNKIDPKLRDAGWGIVPGSNILEYTAVPFVYVPKEVLYVPTDKASRFDFVDGKWKRSNPTY